MRFLKKIYNDSLVKNFFYLMMTNLLNLILGFFFWIIVARYYSPDEVGTTSAILSSMSLISMISTLGFHTAFIFYLPRDRINANRIINSCITSSIVASLVFSFIFILGINIWAPVLRSIFNDLKFVILFATVTTVTTISAHISSAFIAGRRSSFHMTKEILFGFFKILPLQMFSVFGAIGIFMAWGIGVMIAVAVGFFLLSLVWKGYLPALMLDSIIKSMAGYSVGNYLAEIFYTLPRLVLPIMIVNLVSAESTGFFYIAMMVGGLLYGIPQSISNSLLAESSDGGELWHKVKKSIKLNAVILFPGVIFFVFFGKFVLNIFNPLYAENASTTLLILTIASLPVSINTLFTAVRNVQKRVSSVIKINAGIAVLTLAFAFPLSRSSGIEGAAFAFLAANSLAAIVVIYKMKNLVHNNENS
ncbi:lipopolysaccharide biosynthesis protein [Candidatus Methanoperedens sp. BLZ2]|uniref:lipopolysaccharide biosynthesis protein n=1 Tax=Candidatus Methanoperedens sp. BLZ2 TaxID=2035255 RepID=UPI000BE4926F|nr:oligosaccharide flippase family protein [Candidatus Methanoperedens sp. BLZ2]KAB2946255.1 MAG: oligosaccharide flippase family protein [Candidatus Methanoperedens sp.]